MLAILLCTPLAAALPALVSSDPQTTATTVPATAPAVPTAADGAVDESDTASPGPLTIDAMRPVIGYAINAHHISDLPMYLDGVDRIAALGATALVVVTPMYQFDLQSTDIRVLEHRCPTDAQIIAILERARARGLHTAIQPIVLIENPGKSGWRGLIDPTDWDAWWASYDRLIDRFLDITDQVHVDLFCIGSELNSTESDTAQWNRIAERVRDRFPGEITYSANWDRFHKITFWPTVDVMSVSSYFELARDNPDASEAALVNAWTTHRDQLIATATRWGRPLMLSEIGYPSVPWAAAHPWNYVADDDQEADFEAQARCFRAFFHAWTADLTNPAGPVMGFFWYRWDPYHHGESTDTGYGIRGKPAQAELEAGFRRIREAASKRIRGESADPREPLAGPD